MISVLGKICFAFFVLICINSNCIAQPQKQNKVNPNGYNRFFYANGTLSSEGNMVNGKPEGYWRTYFENGNVKSEGNRKNNLLDSLWTFYFPDKKVSAQYFYAAGVKQGLQKDFYPNGNIRSEEMLQNNVKQGYCNYYFENGRLKLKANYDKGRQDGLAINYNSQGEIISVQQYKNGYLTADERLNRRDKFGLKQGTWKTFYENMQLKSEGMWSDDKKNGVFKDYTSDGQILKTEVYKNDELIVQQLSKEVKVEVRKQYYPNGKVKSNVTMVEGIKQGYSNEYDTAGNIYRTVVYRNDKKLAEGKLDSSGKEQGGWTYFYEDGLPKSQGNYINGKKSGDWQYYYAGQVIQQSGKYIDGKPDGEWIWKYANGNLLRVENYVHGKEEGISTEYNEVGKIIAQGNYAGGMKEGKWTFNNGEYIATGMYVDDVQDGYWKTYNADSTIYSEGKYLHGLQQGTHKIYYHNGQLRELQHYKDGIRVDDWKFYDEQGLLLYTLTYAGDVVQKIDGVRMKQ